MFKIFKQRRTARLQAAAALHLDRVLTAREYH